MAITIYIEQTALCKFFSVSQAGSLSFCCLMIFFLKIAYMFRASYFTSSTATDTSIAISE